MIYEKIATPLRRINAHISLSMSLRGWKSPKPTVESDVKEKYTTLIALLRSLEFSLTSYSMASSPVKKSSFSKPRPFF